MRVLGSILSVGALMASCNAIAQVEVRLHRDVAPLVIQDKEVGFSLKKKDTILLPNGTSQLVVRIEKLVEHLGEREKFNSKPVVVTFDAQDSVVNIEPIKSISQRSQAEEFDKNPKFQISVVSGKLEENTQGVLNASNGLTRDYLKELSVYNKENNLQIASTDANIESKSHSLDSGENESKQKDMVQYWFNEGTAEEQKQFADWAFSQRTSVTNMIQTESKPVEMMAYWYDKANKAEKSEILAWLIRQE